MVRPTRVSFFCELDAPHLEAVATAALPHLTRLKAGVTLATRDLSAERAHFIRRLHDAGVPVGVWLVLPLEHGYFVTHDNHALVRQRVEEVVRWLRAETLPVTTLGLDFEPDLRELNALSTTPLSVLRSWAKRARTMNLETVKQTGHELVRDLRAQGFSVESYQFPLLLEDRARGGDWWQRFSGSLDLPVEREVMMLYSSLFGVLGAGVLERYAPRAKAIGIGSTGGGVDPLPKLEWPQFERDLRLAASHCADVSIFSLEGCVERDYLARLHDLDWDTPVEPSFMRHAVGATVTMAGLISRALR